METLGVVGEGEGVAATGVVNTPAAPPTSIYKKLSAVAKDCSYVQKDGVNQFHRYNYATAAIIFEKVNLALFDHGLVSRTEWPHREMAERQTTAGKREIVETLQVKLIVTDIDSGEEVSQFAYGCGADASDKAVMKAQTAALKYAWMMMLNISTGDDPEGDATTDSRAEGKPQPKGKPRGPSGPDRVTLNPDETFNEAAARIAEAKRLRDGAKFVPPPGFDPNVQTAVEKEFKARRKAEGVDPPEPDFTTQLQASIDAVKQKHGRPNSVPDFCQCKSGISKYSNTEGTREYWECDSRHAFRYDMKAKNDGADLTETQKHVLRGHFFQDAGAKK